MRRATKENVVQSHGVLSHSVQHLSQFGANSTVQDTPCHHGKTPVVSRVLTVKTAASEPQSGHSHS